MASALDVGNLSAKQFASNLSVSWASMSQVIRGKVPVTNGLAIKFASAVPRQTLACSFACE